MNIKVQCCGMIILLLVSFFYWRLPRMMVRTKKVFSILLLVSIWCMVIDILSVISICHADQVSNIFVVFMCKLYLFLLILLIYCGLAYLCADLYKDTSIYKRKIWTYGILLVVTGVLMSVLPLHYTSEQGGLVVYSSGLSTTVVYIYFIIVYCSMILHLYIGWKKIQRRRGIAVMLWLIIWLLSAVFQFLSKGLLVVSFGGGLGVVIIFSMIENPELILDRESNFFNITAMTQYIAELYGKSSPFYLVCTSFQTQTMPFYNAVKDAYVFVGGGDIYFLFTDKAKASEVLKRLEAEQAEKMIYEMSDSLIAGSSEELFGLLKSAHSIQKKEQNSYVYMVDESFKAELERRREMEVLIQEAIKYDRVKVFYQPIYSVKEGKFHSAEALIRLQDREGKIVLPGNFIQLAEDDGSIVMLGKCVFDKVCSFLNRYNNVELGIDYIEVNLSVIQGEDQQLVENVMKCMKKYEIQSKQINLEITESASMSGREQLLSNMERLQEQGIEFSLDDFGTGQSNLDYMASMPVQIVKFDKSMTQSYFVSEKTRIIMNATIQMIHDMGMKIVVEGIETKEQFACMEEQGIDYIQGFYFSKPLSEEDFVSFLRKHN